jgi:hypothetical protein
MLRDVSKNLKVVSQILKVITMDNQQETKLLLFMIAKVGSSETTREAS